jgi:Carboxypeptidase regulatory-like domain
MVNRLLSCIAVFSLFLPAYLQGSTYTVEIADVQLVRSLAGTVRDGVGSAVPGVLVEECNPGWKDSLRSTKTDPTGNFTFTPVKSRDIYYFRLTSNGFNQLRVRVKIDHKRGKELRLELDVAT